MNGAKRSCGKVKRLSDAEFVPRREEGTESRAEGQPTYRQFSVDMVLLDQ